MLSNNWTSCHDWSRWNFSWNENWTFLNTSMLSTGNSLMTHLWWSCDWRKVKYFDLQRRLEVQPVTCCSCQDFHFLIYDNFLSKQIIAMHCILFVYLQNNISFPGLICLLIWRVTPLCCWMISLQQQMEFTQSRKWIQR